MRNIVTTYYIGLNDKDTHRQEKTTQEALNIIEDVMDLAGIESYTTSTAQGHYKRELENTIKVELVGMVLSEHYINLLKDRLNQECIMVICKECESHFV